MSVSFHYTVVVERTLECAGPLALGMVPLYRPTYHTIQSLPSTEFVVRRTVICEPTSHIHTMICARFPVNKTFDPAKFASNAYYPFLS
eukprot:scaffold2868_cov171-Amphora_coffeaeformis.AAC.12